MHTEQMANIDVDDPRDFAKIARRGSAQVFAVRRDMENDSYFFIASHSTWNVPILFTCTPRRKLGGTEELEFFGSEPIGATLELPGR